MTFLRKRKNNNIEPKRRFKSRQFRLGKDRRMQVPMRTQKIIILDRDGVINHNLENYIRSPQDWTPIEGSLDAIAELNRNNFTVVIATNQSAINRGYITSDILNDIHNKMLQELTKHNAKISKIYVCPHIPEDNCECRKPKIGLLKKIAHDYDANLKNTILIGDNFTDIQAGLAAGCVCILVLTGKGKETMVSNSIPRQVIIADDLADAVDMITNNYL